MEKKRERKMSQNLSLKILSKKATGVMSLKEKEKGEGEEVIMKS